MSEAITHVIGFDFGHGETAIACVPIEGESTVSMLEVNGQKSQITAIASNQAGQVFIGENALVELTVDAIHIMFKTRPGKPHYDAQRPIMQKFVSAVYRHLIEKNQLNTTERHSIWIGHPSEWAQETIAIYGQDLRATGIPNIELVPESWAAFIYARDKQELRVGRSRKAVIVVDIGSSTTDFTLIKDPVQMVYAHCGADLGGGMLDEAILAAMLQTSDNHDHRPDIEAAFQKGHVCRNRCLLRCRKAKEKYFNNPELYEKGLVTESEKIQKGVSFEINIDGATMRAILREPLAVLAGRSWEQAFRDAVANAHAAFEGAEVGMVILTGGASRMEFTRNICQEFFTSAECRRSSEPEYAIAAGLAHWGRIRISTDGFEQEVQQLIGNELPNFISQAMPDLVNRLAKMLTDGLIDHMLRPGLRDWLDAKVDTLNNLEGHMKGLAEAWLCSPDAQQFIGVEVATWLKTLQDKWDDQVRPICRKYRIPVQSLRLSAVYDEEPDFAGLKLSDPTGLGTIVGMIVGLVVVTVTVVVFGGGTMATLWTGPIGWVLGLIAAIPAGLIALGIGSVATEEILKNFKLPGWFRKRVMSYKKIDETCKEKRNDIEKLVKASLNEPSVHANLLADISAKLTAELQQRLQEARLLID